MHTIPVEATPSSMFRELIAGHLIDATNSCTQLRSDAAPWIGGAVALTGALDRFTQQSDFHDSLSAAVIAGQRVIEHGVTATAGMTAALDMEGGLFRLAKRISANVANPGGGERDHRADKKYLYYLLGGLVAKRVLQEDLASATLIAGVLGTNLARDAAMGYERRRALELNPRANTDAIAINKVKTALLFGGAILATTEWAERGIGRKITHAMLISGTTLGIAGYGKFRRQLRNNV